MFCFRFSSSFHDHLLSTKRATSALNGTQTHRKIVVFLGNSISYEFASVNQSQRELGANLTPNLAVISTLIVNAGGIVL